MVQTDKPVKKEKIAKNVQTQAGIKNRWWLEQEATLFEHVFGVVEAIKTAQNYRHIMNVRFARLYKNLGLLGFMAGLYARPGADLYGQSPISLNVVKSCIDTAAAKIAKNKVQIQFLTDDGDYSQQKKAKNLNKFLEGQFENLDIYQKSQKAFTDCGIFGTGCLYFTISDGQIICDRVLSDELIVDDGEGYYEEPRQIHRQRWISKDILRAMYHDEPDKLSGIENAGARYKQAQPSEMIAADQVMVLESWHLPSGPNSDDGCYAMTLDSVTLEKQSYTKDYFPFSFIRWSDAPAGFWGTGLAEELVGTQLKINKLLANIDIAQDLACVPRVYVENSSQVNIDHLNNEIGAIIKYTGQKPVIETANAMPGEIYSHLQFLLNEAYSITGISQQSAQSKKTPGLESGIAIREMSDIESERLILKGQAWENFFKMNAKLIIDLAKDLYGAEGEDTPKKVKVKASKFIKSIKWKDINLEEDEYVMKAYGVNFLPSTPAGKLQTVQELVQAGFMSKDFALSLFNFPDLEEFYDLQNANIDLTRMLIEKMLDDGEYAPPDKAMNLDQSYTMVHAAYLKAKMQDGIKTSNLNLLLTFMQDIEAIKAENAPPPPPAPPGAPMGAPAPQDLTGAPIAQGAPAPVSPLLPMKSPGS